MRSIGRTILIGLLTLAPLAITWLIVSFIVRQLSAYGDPWVRGLAIGVRPAYPWIAELIIDERVQSAAAVIVMLALLWLLGWGAGRVIGQRLIRLFESAIGAIPFVDGIYRATKRFLAVASAAPEGERRVVLIEFPSPDMKTIGFVTRMLVDRASGEQLVAVYIPTSPNPTSGYVEIVPIRLVSFTDWNFDQAMSFVVTGGSSAPDSIDFWRPDEKPDGSPARDVADRPGTELPRQPGSA